MGGLTYERRPIRGAVLSGRPAPEGEEKQVIFYLCGEHAREWLPVMFCMYMMEELVNGYGKDETITAYLDTYDFHILPVFNVDGYLHSHTPGNNMWRKNRA